MSDVVWHHGDARKQNSNEDHQQQGDLFALAVEQNDSPLRAIEEDRFPIESISRIAEAESWRKEINRPLSHIHKWWAQRLGSIFRAIVIGVFSPCNTDVLARFYASTGIGNKIVFDPFMGSGTTLVEVTKLGGQAIGRDINPVAAFLVKTALSRHDREAIDAEFRRIETDVGERIRKYYECGMPDGSKAEVLYFFWVKIVDCPKCGGDVDLFANYVFARHAYASRYPLARVVCPACGEINESRYDETKLTCRGCRSEFNPQKGPAQGQKATCSSCSEEFSIVNQVRASSQKPRHRMYAKLVLTSDGEKKYLRITPEDRQKFKRASDELPSREGRYPSVAIMNGYNTNQALGYNYDRWEQMFNDRQLLCLSLLAERIASIKEKEIRDLFACLFSGALEFNNQFTSYKGEGTGAVRHMFAHHVLKPERVPLEANLWGTSKSSGSFSTLFKRRIQRALDYSENPFELAISTGRTKKIYGLSNRLGFEIAASAEEFCQGRSVYVSCGDSSNTDIEKQSVDAIITDPPFFDNVHYSELADFFHVWLNLISNSGESLETTRNSKEVQHGEVEQFTDRLSAIWTECHRVLKDDGLLVFTYHHSRPDGWSAILEALVKGNFVISAVHPVKAEMSVAMPKNQAKEPIDLDIIIVCRKSDFTILPSIGDWREAATTQVQRFRSASRKLSRNDVLVIVMAQLIRWCSRDDRNAVNVLGQLQDEAHLLVEQLYKNEM